VFDIELEGLLTSTNYAYLQNEIATAELRMEVRDWLSRFLEGAYRGKSRSLHIQSTKTVYNINGGMKRMYLSCLMYGVSAISWTEFFTGGTAALIFSCFAIDVLR
jgi:hypothetical protein